MRTVTLRGLLDHKLRLALTALAIILGVTFISGTFVLTDTLNSTFSVLFGNIYQHVDFVVRGVPQLRGTNAAREPVPASALTAIRKVPGVQDAQGEIEGYAQFVARDGKAIESGGAATIGLNFDPDSRLSELQVIAGRPPRSADDVVMDAGTAQANGFSVGQRVRVLLAGPAKTFTISGIAKFGTAPNLAGSSIAAFALPVADDVLQARGTFNDIIMVTTPGADTGSVQRAVAAALPSGFQIVTGQTVAGEQTASVAHSLSFFSTALLVFALISLFVGGFTIFNTFAIVVGQRTRELALLRIIGASRGQLFGSVLAESAIVGLASSAIGIGLGVLAAIGLRAIIGGFGISLPAGPLIFEPRTALVGLAVGTGVTVVSAIGPARNAVRIAPVAALSDRRADGEQTAGRWPIGGAVLALAGVGLLSLGLSRPAIALVGVGAACVFLGVAMLTPTLARPLSGVIGRPLARVLGEPGRLGRENSMRSPRRTARTASALMVGVALVSAISVFGASLSRSATSSVDDAISAALILTPVGGIGGFSTLVPATAARVPGVTAETAVYQGQFVAMNSLVTLTAAAPRQLADTTTLNMTAGNSGALNGGELLIDTTTARQQQLSIGDPVPVKFARTGPTVLYIGGIFQPNALIGSYLVSDTVFLAHFAHPLPIAVLLATTGSAVTARVTQALASFPEVQVRTKAQFEQSTAASVNQLIGLVYALLALAVLIALIGIVNTLMLSVLDRTREIGLLRAVGMQRGQVRAMVRAEAVIMAIFGAITGVVIGTPMGIALVSALRQDGITRTAIPVDRLVIFIVLSALLGLVAASWPARRAADLDVLAAIATQ